MTDERATYTAGNKAAWEASAPAHGRGVAWEELLRDAAAPGFSVLDETLTALLRSLDPEGRTAVQIGCNNARELLSLASLGIVPKLGIDQSPAFLALGQRLCAASGHAPRLVAADVYDLPDDLGTYDIALITIGVLNWMPDLPRFFEVVAGLMTPGGVLVVYETHPMLEMLEPDAEDPFTPVHSYFDKGPVEVPEMIVYDDAPETPSGAVGYWFIHTMGEIVTAVAGAGLAVARLEEFPHSNREGLYDKYQDREAQLPMSYALVARKGR